MKEAGREMCLQPAGKQADFGVLESAEWPPSMRTGGTGLPREESFLSTAVEEADRCILFDARRSQRKSQIK